MKNKNILIRIFDKIKSIFLNGLLILLPMTVTIALFTYGFKLLKNWLEPIHQLEPAFLQQIPYSEFLLVITLIFVIGIIFKSFILKPILHGIEAILFKLPLVYPIYSGIKQIVHAFTVQDEVTFKQVVLVEFPKENMYSIGFLTREVPQALSPHKEKTYFNIFIPTTPNPTTGYLVLTPKEDITIVDMTRQEAMSLIISGGIIQPERLKKRPF